MQEEVSVPLILSIVQLFAFIAIVLGHLIAQRSMRWPYLVSGLSAGMISLYGLTLNDRVAMGITGIIMLLIIAGYAWEESMIELDRWHELKEAKEMLK